MVKREPAAFVSYSREDSEFVLRLADDLKAAGASVWLDQRDIVAGQRWDRAVEDALTKCARMVVILSPDAVSSTNVMDEVSFALEEQKTIIPVIYRDCAIPKTPKSPSGSRNPMGSYQSSGTRIANTQIP